MDFLIKKIGATGFLLMAFVVSSVHGDEADCNAALGNVSTLTDKGSSEKLFQPKTLAQYEEIISETPYDDTGMDFRKTFGKFLFEHRATLDNFSELAQKVFDERMAFAKRHKTFFATQLEPNWQNVDLPDIKKWLDRIQGKGEDLAFSFGVTQDYRAEGVLKFLKDGLDAQKANWVVIDGATLNGLPQAPPSGPVTVLAWDYVYKDGERKVIYHIYKVDEKRIYLTHAKNSEVPALLERANVLWKKIFDGETPQREKLQSLAEFEWVWYWTNPFARAGALSGDILVLLLKEELLRQGIRIPIRTQYINQDLKAFLYEVEAYKEMRVKHWEETQ